MKTTLVTVLAALSAGMAMAGFAQTAGAAEAGEVRCLNLQRIEHTQAVDDQNILFYMRDGHIYLNHLSHRAPGLDRNRPFMYKTSTGSVCNHDFVTVLEAWGFGFTEGATSSLGRFMLIDEARADALKRGEPDGVELEPVEED